MFMLWKQEESGTLIRLFLFNHIISKYTCDLIQCRGSMMNAVEAAVNKTNELISQLSLK